MGVLRKDVLPRPGDISPDRVAILGRNGSSDLFLGTNDYYLQYWEPPREELVQSVVDWTVEFRESALSLASAVFVMIIPSKLTCLQENYPLFVPRRETPVFAGVREILSQYSGNCFFPWMTEGSYLDREQYWFKHDSHWSSIGAEQACRWILDALGIPFDRPVINRTESYYGDLAGRWSSQRPLLEDLVHHELDAVRDCVRDNADGTLYSANTGRLVEWHAGESAVNGHLLVLGDSFSGAGYSPWNMTYWLSSFFTKTTFIHSFHVPEDLITTLRPDFVVYQTNERFLRQTPIAIEKLSVVLDAFDAKTSNAETT